MHYRGAIQTAHNIHHITLNFEEQTKSTLRELPLAGDSTFFISWDVFSGPLTSGSVTGVLRNLLPLLPIFIEPLSSSSLFLGDFLDFFGKLAGDFSEATESSKQILSVKHLVSQSTLIF